VCWKANDVPVDVMHSVYLSGWTVQSARLAFESKYDRCPDLQNMHYVRIYTDAHGETHFQDVTLATELRTSPVSTARAELAAPLAVGQATFRRVVEDHPPEPHVAPRRQLVVHLAGEAEVEVSDGEVRRFGPGSVALVDDLTGKGHLTRRVGDTPRETLMVTLDDEPGGT
jgi:hypothetical protein